MDKMWCRVQAKAIEKRLREQHGNGWNLLSAAQREAYVEQQVLSLILSQIVEAYAPAQEMAQGVIEVLHNKEMP